MTPDQLELLAHVEGLTNMTGHHDPAVILDLLPASPGDRDAVMNELRRLEGERIEAAYESVEAYLRRKLDAMELAIRAKDGDAAADVVTSIGREGYPLAMRVFLGTIVDFALGQLDSAQRADLITRWAFRS